MAIVSNSSPLILYARIARLDLLRDLFGEVLIPPAVHQEVVVAGGHHLDAGTVGSAPWIQSRVLSNLIVPTPCWLRWTRAKPKPLPWPSNWVVQPP